MALSPPSSVGLNGVMITDTPSATEVLTADSATAASWQAPAASGIPATILDAKGDLIGASAADTAARLAVGTDGAFLRALSSEATGLVWQAGVRVVELFDSTLGADTASIDTGAGGFTGTLDHLLIVTLFRTDQAATILSSVDVTINNDGAGNYDNQTLRGRDTTASTADGQAGSAISINAPGASAAAGVFGACLTVIPAYSQTVAEKAGVMMGYFADEAATGGDAGTRSFHWRSTAAITRLIFSGVSASNLVTGSRVTVYGIG